MPAVRNFALLPGPAPTWTSEWVEVLPTAVRAEDICNWPYSVGLLVKLGGFASWTVWEITGLMREGGSRGH